MARRHAAARGLNGLALALAACIAAAQPSAPPVDAAASAAPVVDRAAPAWPVLDGPAPARPVGEATGSAPVGDAAAVAPPGAPAYSIDPTHTFVHWSVLHMGTSTIRGRFGDVSGALQFDSKAQLLDVSIGVAISAVSSGVPVLDGLLRGTAMLDAAAHPQAFFVARGARFDGEVPREIRGEFTLRGVSQPLTLRALRWNCGLNPLFRREVCGGDFEAEFNRSAFGITHSLPFVADTVRLVVQIEAIRR